MSHLKIITDCCLAHKTCINLHVPIRNSQIALRVTGQPRLVGSQYGPCCLSAFWSQEFGVGS